MNRAEHLCGRGESLCWGHINLQSDTVPYICCPQGWECVRRNGMPDCKLPNSLENWFKQKLGKDVFGNVMKRVYVTAPR